MRVGVQRARNGGLTYDAAMGPDSKSLRDAYAAVEGLHSWSRAGQRAPHKPLLILLALSRTKAAEPRLVEFSAIERPLRDLLVRYGPERKHHHPEYPFWRLQSDRIWEVIGGESLPRRVSNTDPLASLDYSRDSGMSLPVSA